MRLTERQLSVLGALFGLCFGLAGVAVLVCIYRLKYGRWPDEG